MPDSHGAGADNWTTQSIIVKLLLRGSFFGGKCGELGTPRERKKKQTKNDNRNKTRDYELSYQLNSSDYM